MTAAAAAYSATVSPRMRSAIRKPPTWAGVASPSMIAVKAASITELEAALEQAKANTRTTVVVIDTDPLISTGAGGAWWDVAVPEVSEREQVRAARADYDVNRQRQRVGQ